MFSGFVSRFRGNARALSGLRLISSRADSPSLVILNPREAGIIKRPRHKRGESNNLNQLQTSLLEPNLPQISAVAAIHSYRPESHIITEQRYSQLQADLTRGFKKQQLTEYLVSQGFSLPKKTVKRNLVNRILEGAWNCSISVQGESALHENTIDLSERDFVLLLGGRGWLLREWSKSGARISMLASRFQIRVQSQQRTFDWISASLSKFLEGIVATEVDISELKKLANPLDNPAYLSAIQQLTDTYFGNNDPESDSITVYSAGVNKLVNAALVRRLMLYLVEPVVAEKWRPSSWNYDANLMNHESYYLHPFEDTESMEWIHRLKFWTRWEALKRRSGSALGEVDLKELTAPQFDSTALEAGHAERSINPTAEPDASNRGLEQQILSISEKLVSRWPLPEAPDGSPVSTTLTITPGYVLQSPVGGSLLPNAGMLKTFTPNIPYVSNAASTLPFFSKDIQQGEESINHQSAGAIESWMDILDFSAAPKPKPVGPPTPDGSGEKVYTARRKDMPLDMNMRLIQIKFVANPHEGLALEYPPIEAWATLSKNDFGSSSMHLTEVPRILAVPLEANTHVSLPGEKSDLKITLAYTYPIQATKETETYFLKKCVFGRSNPIRIDPEVEFNVDGKAVSYLYHSCSYVTLSELELNKSLVQLSQVEGGKLSGRRIEASLVSHSEFPEKMDLDSVKATVRNAVEFIQKL